MSVDRVTVDLSAYPDLVMILLGMRVNTATGLKTLLGFGPQIAKVPQDMPDGLFPMRFSCGRSSPRTPAFGSTGATLLLWKLGHAPPRTANGGRPFFAIPGVPASGMRPISCAAAWKRSSTIFQSRSASCVLHRGAPRKAACLRRASGPQP